MPDLAVDADVPHAAFSRAARSGFVVYRKTL